MPDGPDKNAQIQALLAEPTDIIVTEEDNQVMSALGEHDPDFKADLRDMEKVYAKRRRQEIQGLKEEVQKTREERKKEAFVKRSRQRLRRREKGAGARGDAPRDDVLVCVDPGEVVAAVGGGGALVDPIEDGAPLVSIVPCDLLPLWSGKSGSAPSGINQKEFHKPSGS